MLPPILPKPIIAKRMSAGVRFVVCRSSSFVPRLRSSFINSDERITNNDSRCSQDASCRRAVEALQSQWQADQLVLSRRWIGELESLDDDHAGAKQRFVRLAVAGVKLLDREVVDADELDALRDEYLGRVWRDIGEVGMKVALD